MPSVTVPPLPIAILEFPTLILLLGQLGYELVRGYRDIKAVGKALAKGGVFRSANGVEVEVTVTEDGKLSLCVDEKELRAKEGLEKGELHEKILQAYSYKKVIEQLEAKGFTLVEEQELDTGTIRLVVRKWS